MKNSSLLYLPFLLATSLLSLLLGGCSQKPESARAQASDPQVNAPSIYQSTGEWHNQHGDTLRLSSLEGKIPVMAMVFTQCTYACSRIVADIKNMEKQIPRDKKDKVVFVLVSFDSERDQPARLKAFASQMQLNDNWVLLHGNEEEVRELSMLLEVKYKKQPNGDFAHSNGITLLNRQGAIVTRVEGLGVNARPLLDELSRL
jgi:protein SCO1